MISIDNIRDHMPIVDSDGIQFAKVDHMDGADTIKLTKDNMGHHHWIPMTWVTEVDKEVHVDRPQSKAMHDWLSAPPA